MDPTAALVRYIQAAMDSDLDAMDDAHGDLSDWLGKHGYAPVPSAVMAELAKSYPASFAKAAESAR
jgi:hypothetical protein